jgi:hypothetical protein
VEDLLKSHNEAKRNKIVKWEPFSSNRRYLEIGETARDIYKKVRHLQIFGDYVCRRKKISSDR